MSKEVRRVVVITPIEKGNPIVFPPGRPNRNEKCHCKSGKKYKACCLLLDEQKLMGKA